MENNYPLDEEAIQMIATADEQIRTINGQVNGMLSYIIRKAKLADGQWRIADNRRELVSVNGNGSAPPQIP